MGQKGQSLVFSEYGQLSQAILQFHVEPILTPTSANRAIRIAAQRTQGLQGPISVFLGEIWPPTNASDLNCGDNSR